MVSPRAMLLSGPELWLGDMSGSMLSSVAPIVIGGIVTTQGLYALLGPCWSLRPTLLLGPCQSERPKLPPGAMVTSRPELLLMDMFGSVVLWQLESVLRPITCVTAGAHTNRVLNHELKYKGLTQLALPHTGQGEEPLSSPENGPHPSPVLE